MVTRPITNRRARNRLASLIVTNALPLHQSYVLRKSTVKQFFRCILIWRIFSIKIPIILYCLHITKNMAYHITELLIFYAD